MNHVWLTLTAAMPLALGGGADAVQTERGKLQGIWVVEKVITRDGPRTGKAWLEFQGDKVKKISEDGGKKIVMEGQYTLDPTQKPPTLELVFQKGKAAVVDRCIYEIQGNTLKLCQALVSDMERPRAVEAGKNAVLIILKKQKK